MHKKADWLLELGCEEIPARFLLPLAKQLQESVEKFFEKFKISYKSTESYSTPRRLAVMAKQVALQQEQFCQEVRGPALSIARDSKGEWTKPALGFARKYGMHPKDLSVQEVQGEPYLFAKVEQGGQKTSECLLEGIPKLLQDLSFVSSMHFGPPGVRFVRPVRWLLLMHGDQVIPFQWAGLEAGCMTRGHRFLGETVVVREPRTYVQQLREQSVLADRKERQQRIVEQLRALEQRENFVIDTPADLLEEVTDLVEFPTAFVGSLPLSSMELPEDVLLTTMRVHQRYFPVRTPSGEMAPFFVSVRNGNEESMETVVVGNEQVIAARLLDARFFYDTDQKQSLPDFVERLDRIVGHEKLGSVRQRVHRLGALARILGPRYGLTAIEQKDLERAVELCKFDLSTMMVQEFPELEGIMGAYYAGKAGESAVVVKAIQEHLLPRHATDQLPESKLGNLLALIDKMETVTAYFSIGIRPTGSQDPHGLRRRAQAIVTLLLDPAWSSVVLSELWNLTLDELSSPAGQQEPVLQEDREEVVEHLRQFFHLRIAALLEKSSLAKDTCQALAAGSIDIPCLILDKGKVLEKARQSSTFREEIEAFIRVSKLAEQAGAQGKVDESLLQDAAEKDLYCAFQKAEKSFLHAEGIRDAQGMYQALASTVPEIHRFFSEVMVMVEDQKVRTNRLSLLRSLAHYFGSFADMSKLMVSSESE